MFYNVEFIKSENKFNFTSNYEYDDILDYNQFESIFNKNDYNNFYYIQFRKNKYYLLLNGIKRIYSRI